MRMSLEALAVVHQCVGDCTSLMRKQQVLWQGQGDMGVWVYTHHVQHTGMEWGRSR